MNAERGMSLADTRVFRASQIRKHFAFWLRARDCVGGVSS